MKKTFYTNPTVEILSIRESGFLMSSGGGGGVPGAGGSNDPPEQWPTPPAPRRGDMPSY